MGEPTALRHRSYSQLNAVRQCGWAYFLERVAKVPSQPSAPAVAGKAVHTATELVDKMIYEGVADGHHLTGAGSKLAVMEMDGEIETLSDEHPIDTWKVYGKQDISWWRETGLPQSVSAYVNWRLENPTIKVADIPGFGQAVEVPFEISLNGVPVRGYIDRVYVTEMDVLLVVDLKSGLKPKTDEQLGLYRAALELATGREYRWGAYLYGLKTGTASMAGPIDLTHWTVDKLAGVYASADKIIRNELFLPAPGPSCFTCSVSAHCDYSRAAI